MAKGFENLDILYVTGKRYGFKDAVKNEALNKYEKQEEER